MALTKVTGQVIKNTTDVTVGVLTVTNTLAVGGTVSIGGTLTYEDVTNVDAVGLITARNGIVVGSGITLSKDGDVFVTGISTFGGAIKGSSGTFTDAVTIVKSSGPLLELTTNTSAADATLRLSEGATGSTSNGGGMFYSGADNKLYITCGTNSTTKRITINRDDGLVGIGSDAPTHNLDIHASGNPYLKLLRSGYNPVYIGNAAGEGVIETTGATFFKTGGSERLRITSAGLVGINTTSPNRRFTLYQDTTTRMNLKSLATSTVGIEFGDPDDENIGYIVYDNSDNSLKFGVNAGERIRIYSGGQVSIRNTNATSFNTGGDDLVIGNGTDTADAGITLYSHSSDNGSIFFNDTADTGITGLIQYRHDVDCLRFFTATSERLRITSGGEMGLGTATPPTGSFHIHLTETPELNLFSTQHSQGNHCKLNFGVGQSASVSGNTGARIEMNIPNAGGAMNGELKFHTNGGDNLVEKVRIPAQTWGLLVTNLSSTGATGGYQTIGVSLRQGGDSTFVADGAAAVTMTRKTNAGKVLDFYSGTNYAGGVYVNGQNSAQYQSTSDYRLKDNVSSMSDGISKVKQLNPIYYTNKQIGDVTDTTTVHNGFLAHEVQSIIPSLVDGDKDGAIDERGKGYQTLNYAGLTPTAIAAIKELIAKVETLETEVAALKSS